MTDDTQKALLIDYKVTFETVSGQRVLQSILYNAYVTRPFPTDKMEQTQKLEGARVLALEIQRNYDRAVALARGIDEQPGKATASLSEES